MDGMAYILSDHQIWKVQVSVCVCVQTKEYADILKTLW